MILKVSCILKENGGLNGIQKCDEKQRNNKLKQVVIGCIACLDNTHVMQWANREIKIRVYGKRQTSDSRFRSLKIDNKYTRIVKNNSRVYG